MIEHLFSANIITEELRSTDVPLVVLREEADIVRDASKKRQNEFLAGRHCARRALMRLSVHDFPLLAGEDRVPIWPGGIVGSISHADGYCGVALAREEEVQSVGLDIECICEVGAECWKMICTDAELRWLTSLPLTEQQDNAAIIFSAKECFYKCQYAMTKRWLDFHDVEIDIDTVAGQFVAQIAKREQHLSIYDQAEGNYLFNNGYVLTGIALCSS